MGCLYNPVNVCAGMNNFELTSYCWIKYIHLLCLSLLFSKPSLDRAIVCFYVKLILPVTFLKGTVPVAVL